MRLQAKPKGRMVHSYETYPSTHISRSKFNRSHSLLTSMNSGYLVPIYYDEAYPADTLELSCSTFARLATQIVPFMDNVYMDVHFFVVPNRLTYENWEKLNGQQDAPGDSTDYLTPQLSSSLVTSEITTGSIFDYFGIPIGIKGLKFNAFNFRAYNLIYNEWYRDENLIVPVTVEKGDTDSMSNYTLLKRGKRKDYFTSCLPSPQKGPAVDLPLGLTAPVIGNGTAIGLTDNVKNYGLFSSISAYNPLGGNTVAYGSSVGSATGNGSNGTDKSVGLTTDSTKSGLIADLSEATASTINSLRQAFALQRLYETDARGGTRYTEMILAHFGVKSPDARLQRPEFIGGATFNLNLSAVPQTSSTNSTSPQGTLTSYGTIMGNSRKIVHSFTEHCVVIGLASIRADLTYQQGLDRLYSRRNRTDFYLPTLCNLGEQAVLNKEIFAQGTTQDDDVFGYQERWAEMRHKHNRITGQLRSNADTSLDVWHLSQDFENLPVLNEQFINEDPPIDRVIAVAESANTPQFISNFWFEEYWTRPMSVYSIPSMSSHF